MMAMEEHHDMDLLRLITAGSVDDGKSTLIGRLLYDTKAVFEDHLDAIKQYSVLHRNSDMDLALITDGLRAERTQGITIDVAYRYFSTSKRKFILADAPGHMEYTRNMVTAASTANLALILVDATRGIVEQTRRHVFIASLLQIKHLVICINKMDLVGYSEHIFLNIRKEFEKFSLHLEIQDIHYLPISALKGDNIVHKSLYMPWYQGGTLLYMLENIHIINDRYLQEARFPVQHVIKTDKKKCGYAGNIEGGIFEPDNDIMVWPSGKTTKINSIEVMGERLARAFPKMAVMMTLKDDVDIQRGNLITKTSYLPEHGQEIDVTLCWLVEQSGCVKKHYIMKHTANELECIIEYIAYKLDITTLEKVKNDSTISMNDIVQVIIKASLPIYYDSYKKNRTMGSLILIDPSTNETVAAGMIK